jgi:flagellar basal body-associated protein FliL
LLSCEKVIFGGIGMRKIKNFLIISFTVIILAGMMGCSVMMAPAFSGCTKEEVTQEKPKEEPTPPSREMVLV